MLMKFHTIILGTETALTISISSLAQEVVKNGSVLVYDAPSDQPKQGIDITSTANEALSLTGGKVLVATSISEGHHSVIIKGNDSKNYVYGKLKTLLVKKGDKVAAGQHLGELTPLSADKNVLHFEIWEPSAQSEKPALLNHFATKKILGYTGAN